MTYGPLAIKRRQVLGDLYADCDPVESVPVHLDNADGEKIGFADESLGHYADAFLFHVPEDVCKKLSTGHYIYSFDYDYTDPGSTGRHRRITLNSIFLTGRKVLSPVSRSSKKAAAAEITETTALENA